MCVLVRVHACVRAAYTRACAPWGRVRLHAYTREGPASLCGRYLANAGAQGHGAIENAHYPWRGMTIWFWVRR